MSVAHDLILLLTKRKALKMYAYSYATNSVNKYESIQTAVADQYSYLDEAEAIALIDPLGDDELTDEQVSLLMKEAI
jgi:hypothetical protein